MKLKGKMVRTELVEDLEGEPDAENEGDDDIDGAIGGERCATGCNRRSRST